MHIITDAPEPGTEAWRKLITASKVPAILGLSPWQSPYSIAVAMQPDYEEPELPDSKKDLFAYGHAMELGMAEYWSNKNPGWELSPGEVAYADSDIPFPNLVTVDRIATNQGTGEQVIVEMKTISNFDSLSKWGKPGQGNSVPDYYRYQVLTQMGITRIHKAYVVALSIGPPEIHEVKWSPVEWANTLRRCTAFYRAVERGEFPSLDDSTATYEAVRGLHPEIDKDRVVVVSEDEAMDLIDAKENLSKAKDREIGAKSAMLDRLGTAQRAVCNGVVVARRQKGRNGKPELRVPSGVRQNLMAPTD